MFVQQFERSGGEGSPEAGTAKPLVLVQPDQKQAHAKMCEEKQNAARATPMFYELRWIMTHMLWPSYWVMVVGLMLELFIKSIGLLLLGGAGAVT